MGSYPVSYRSRAGVSGEQPKAFQRRGFQSRDPLARARRGGGLSDRARQALANRMIRNVGGKLVRPGTPISKVGDIVSAGLDVYTAFVAETRRGSSRFLGSEFSALLAAVEKFQTDLLYRPGAVPGGWVQVWDDPWTFDVSYTGVGSYAGFTYEDWQADPSVINPARGPFEEWFIGEAEADVRAANDYWLAHPGEAWSWFETKWEGFVDDGVTAPPIHHQNTRGWLRPVSFLGDENLPGSPQPWFEVFPDEVRVTPSEGLEPENHERRDDWTIQPDRFITPDTDLGAFLSHVPLTMADLVVTIQPGTSTLTKPDASGAPWDPHSRDQRVTELYQRKVSIHSTAAGRAAYALVNAGYGFTEQVDILHKALPKKAQAKRWRKAPDGKWHRHKVTKWDKAQAIWAGKTQIDYAAWAQGLVNDAIEDTVVALLGKPAKDLYKHTGGATGNATAFGFQQRMVNQASQSDESIIPQIDRDENGTLTVTVLGKSVEIMHRRP